MLLPTVAIRAIVRSVAITMRRKMTVRRLPLGVWVVLPSRVRLLAADWLLPVFSLWPQASQPLLQVQTKMMAVTQTSALNHFD
jgi:hypothetical protein